jgi:hypothetical protein
MGKTTQYHPISLTVLRGCMIHSGFKPGRFTRVVVNFNKNLAIYKVELSKLPADLYDVSPARVAHYLQEAFMDDVKVIGVWYTRQNRYLAELRVQPPTNPIGFDQEPALYLDGPHPAV